MSYENSKLQQELLKASRMNSNELKCALIRMNVVFKKGLQPQNYYKTIYMDELSKRYDRSNILLPQENSIVEQSPLNRSINSSGKKSLDKTMFSQNKDILSSFTSEKKKYLHGNILNSAQKGSMSNFQQLSASKQNSVSKFESYLLREEFIKQNSFQKQNLREQENPFLQSRYSQELYSFIPQQQNNLKNVLEIGLEDSEQKIKTPSLLETDKKNIFQLRMEDKSNVLKDYNMKIDSKQKEIAKQEEYYQNHTTNISPKVELINNFEIKNNSGKSSCSKKQLSKIKQLSSQEHQKTQYGDVSSSNGQFQRQSLQQIFNFQQQQLQQRYYVNQAEDSKNLDQSFQLNEKKKQSGRNQDSIFDQIIITENSLKEQLDQRSQLQQQLQKSSLQRSQISTSQSKLNNQFSRVQIEGIQSGGNSEIKQRRNVSDEYQKDRKYSDMIFKEQMNSQSFQDIQRNQDEDEQNVKQRQLINNHKDTVKQNQHKNIIFQQKKRIIREVDNNTNVNQQNCILRKIQKILLIILAILLAYIILCKLFKRDPSILDVKQYNNQFVNYESYQQKQFEIFDDYQYPQHMRDIQIRGLFSFETESNLTL